MMDPQIGWHQPEQRDTENYHIWESVMRSSGFFTPFRHTQPIPPQNTGAGLVSTAGTGLVIAQQTNMPTTSASASKHTVADKTNAPLVNTRKLSSTESLVSSSDSDPDAKDSDRDSGSMTSTNGGGLRSPPSLINNGSLSNGFTHHNNISSVPNLELNGLTPQHPAVVPDVPRNLLVPGSFTNIASTFNMDANRHLIRIFRGTPWREKSCSGKSYPDGTDGLHQEIVDFHAYMRPTPEEASIRKLVVQSIEDVITARYPNVLVDVFGSFRTQLYLPTSDIDMVVFGQWEHGELPLYTLSRCLVSAGICEEDQLKVLDKATVPIIKITCKIARIRVDISFNTNNGVKSAELINSYKHVYPEMEPLVFVLKQFLLQRDLNEVFTGGISSYSLILMVVSFLQKYQSLKNDFREHSMNDNFGTLLIKFFELYGHIFNYWSCAISLRDGGSYLPKSEIQRNMDPSYRPNFLTIEDPLNIRNDIGKSSYGAQDVKRSFEYAFNTLSTACGPNAIAMNRRNSILGRIVLVTDAVVRYREWVQTEVFNAVAPTLKRRNLFPLYPLATIHQSKINVTLPSSISPSGIPVAHGNPSLPVVPMVSHHTHVQPQMPPTPVSHIGIAASPLVNNEILSPAQRSDTRDQSRLLSSSATTASGNSMNTTSSTLQNAPTSHPHHSSHHTHQQQHGAHHSTHKGSHHSKEF